MAEHLSLLELVSRTEPPISTLLPPVTPQYKIQIQSPDVNTPGFVEEVTRLAHKEQEALRARGQGTSWYNQNLFSIYTRFHLPSDIGASNIPRSSKILHS
eukprot:3513680-Ditylum_brightwellii.AAC.1